MKQRNLTCQVTNGKIDDSHFEKRLLLFNVYSFKRECSIHNSTKGEGVYLILFRVSRIPDEEQLKYKNVEFLALQFEIGYDLLIQTNPKLGEGVYGNRRSEATFFTYLFWQKNVALHLSWSRFS
jgi:hypothetical protein